MPRHEVTIFGEYMEHKLKLNDHKGGWETIPIATLFEKLRREVDELEEAVREGSNLDRILEAADVANFAMMIAWNSMQDQTRLHFFGSDPKKAKNEVQPSLPGTTQDV